MKKEEKKKVLHTIGKIAGNILVHVGSYQAGKWAGTYVGRNKTYVGLAAAAGSIIGNGVAKSKKWQKGFEFATTFSAGIASGKPKADGVGVAGDGDTTKNRFKSLLKEAGYTTRIKIAPKYWQKVGLSSLAGLGNLNDQDFTSFEEIAPLSLAERQQFDQLLNENQISGFSELDTRQLGETMSSGNAGLRSMKL